MRAFIDTFALIAWLNPEDSFHAEVCNYLSDCRDQLVTTEWVLMEVADALSAPHARNTVIDFLQTVRADPKYEVIDYGTGLYNAGFNLFSSRGDKSWSLTDCISFTVMGERHLTVALTGDYHFMQAGYFAVFAVK